MKMLDINTKYGSFSSWKSVYCFMVEENLDSILVSSVVYCLETISSKPFSYSQIQVRNMKEV